MKRKLHTLAISSMLLACVAASAESNHVKIGVGTDASLGLAVGAEYQLTMEFGSQSIRVGPAFYYNSWTETYTEVNTYEESATTLIFGVSANTYIPTSNDPSLNFILGGGAAFMSYDWQETSEGDSSIGPLVNGLYTDTDEGSGASVFFNFGVSKALSDSMAVELNVPLFLVPYGYGTTLAPALLVSLSLPI